MVEEIISRRNVRLTGHDDWYPMAFFLKSAESEILGGLLGTIRHTGNISRHLWARAVSGARLWREIVDTTGANALTLHNFNLYHCWIGLFLSPSRVAAALRVSDPGWDSSRVR